MKNPMFDMAAAEYGMTALPEDPVVAMAYVPYQLENSLYTPDEGMVNGTMFPVLDKPFLCGGMNR